MLLLAPHTEGLRKLSEFPMELALPRAAAFLARLVKDPDFVESQILPLLEETRGREDWHVARRHDANDGSYSLKVFLWPLGTWTNIHDHSSWGSLLLRHWHSTRRALRAPRRRLPARPRPPEEGLATVMGPGRRSLDGTARRRRHSSVGNPGESMAVSVHLYGPRMGEVDGRDYDPSFDRICDRREN